MLLSSIKIQNYKSIDDLTIPLGRVTVLIGANGCGKSNILEAIAMLGAACANKLDNEFLQNRGIRLTPPNLMRSAFEDVRETIILGLREQEGKLLQYALEHNNEEYSSWSATKLLVDNESIPLDKSKKLESEAHSLKKEVEKYKTTEKEKTLADMEHDLDRLEQRLLDFNKRWGDLLGLYERWIPILDQYKNTAAVVGQYAIYSPENNYLRVFEREGQLQPLGINGEGLLKLLRVMQQKSPHKVQQLKCKMHLIDWFEDFQLPEEVGAENEHVLHIVDRYIQSLPHVDQRSANEGFLFLLFYLTLMISEETPTFFAVDNMDASLNPKLCSRLMEEITQLAKEHNKQVILTTHNPAILDGFNIHDEDNILYVVSRSKGGKTKIRRVHKKNPPTDQIPVKLSEAFLKGYIGGAALS